MTAGVRDWRWAVGLFGRVLVATGVLLFGFVGYQLWGTGIETARAQNRLEDEFAELLAATPGPASTTAAPTTTIATTDPPSSDADTTSPPTTPAPVVQDLPQFEEGDVVARLEIPSIDVDKYVVAGVDPEDLHQGPGHYPDTPLPGQFGNAAIAGHRTTWGQPFFRIDEVEPGDEIVVTTPAGRFTYRVTGTAIVGPSDYFVVATDDPTIATLTLTSCHPRWSAKQRIVVTARLDDAASDPIGAPVINYGRPPEDSDAPTGDTTGDTTGDGGPGVATGPGDTTTVTDAPGAIQPGDSSTLADPIDGDVFSKGWFSDASANPHVAAWGLVLIGIALGATALSRRTGRNLVGALIGIVPFLVALYFFFQNVNRLLPPAL
jgi:sortase A